MPWRQPRPAPIELRGGEQPIRRIRLRPRLAGSDSAWPRRAPGIGRRIFVWVLLALATGLLIAATLTLWLKREALDADRWAGTSRELLQNDQVRGALSEYMVDELYQNVNVAVQLRQRLPEQAQALAAPLAVGLREVAARAANFLLERPQVQELWEGINRRAAGELVAVLDGKPVLGAKTDNGEVVLDLRPFVQKVAGLIGVSTDELPSDAGRLVLLRSGELKTAQQGVRALRVLSVFLVVVVLFLYALAVVLAAGRRRVTLRAIGWALVVAAVLLLVVRRLAGGYLADRLAGAQFHAAANSAWLVATDLLRAMATLILVVGLLLVLAVSLAGPTRPARAIRRALAPWYRHRPGIVFGVVSLVLLLVMLLGPSAGGHTWWGVLLLFGLILSGTEALRRQALREFPEDRQGGEGWHATWELLTRRLGRHRPPPPEPAEAKLGLLERLTTLRDRGALNAEEFEAQKTAILSGRISP
jgi:hypothetical protein